MKLTAVVTVLLFPVVVAVAAERLPISPGNSDIEFVGQKVVGSEEGAFETFSGAVILDAGNARASSVDVTIEMASVKTKRDRLTEHLKNGDFFDVERFPRARFRSTAIRTARTEAATHLVTGELELRGVRNVIHFPATITVSDERLRIAAEFTIDRTQFGIEYDGLADNAIRDEVIIRLRLDLPRAGGRA